MDKTFTKDVNELYKHLRELGDRARIIITDFVNSHGGNYSFDTDNEDHIWVGEEAYSTALKIDRNGNVLVFNSAEYSEYLRDMDDYNILDIANYITNI